MGKLTIGDWIIAHDPSSRLKLDELALRTDQISDGQYLRRVGNEIVGATVSGGGGAFPTKPFIIRTGEVLEFDTVQNAINNAIAGETIYVPAGDYNERLSVNKVINIFGLGPRGAQRINGGLECSTGSRFVNLRFSMTPTGNGWILIHLTGTSSPIFTDCEFSVYSEYSGTAFSVSDYLLLEFCTASISTSPSSALFFVDCERLFVFHSILYSSGPVFASQSQVTDGAVFYFSALHGSTISYLIGRVFIRNSLFIPYLYPTPDQDWLAIPVPGREFGDIIYWDGSRWTIGQPSATIPRIAVFTFEGELSPTTGRLRIYNCTDSIVSIKKVFLAVDSPPYGNAIIVDVLLNGHSIFLYRNNYPQISSGEYTGYLDGIEQDFEPGDYITVDILQVGDEPGSHLTVHVLYL